MRNSYWNHRITLASVKCCGHMEGQYLIASATWGECKAISHFTGWPWAWADRFRPSLEFNE